MIGALLLGMAIGAAASAVAWALLWLTTPRGPRRG